MSEAEREGISPGYILEGTIISVNGMTHKVEVSLENVQGAVPDVQIASMYCHPSGGEGVYVMPEPGASCYVCFPSDGTRPFVFAFIMPPTAVEGDAGGRESLQPGDTILSTRDDNKVILRRGGVVEIGATSLSQRLYIPLTNFVRDFFANYEALSLLGNIRWTHDDISSGSTKVHYSFDMKEETTDPLPKVVVELSSELGVPEVPVPYLDTKPTVGTTFNTLASYLRIRVKASDFLSNSYLFEVSKTGDQYIKSDGFMLMECSGTHRVSFKDGWEVVGSTSAYQNKVNSTGSRREELTELEVTALQRIIEKAPEIVLESIAVKLGGSAAAFKVPRGEALLGWLRALTINPYTMRPIIELPPNSVLLSPNVKVL
jgi:hypothetical protein